MSDYTGLIGETTVGITVPGNAFGMGYSSFKLERKVIFTEPVNSELCAAHEADLAAEMTKELIENFKKIVADVQAAAPALPAQASPGITQAAAVPQYQAAPMAQPQAVANAGTQAGVGALMNGTAVPDDGIVSVDGRYGVVNFPHPNALAEQALVDGVKGLLAAPDIQVHPSQVKVFDNRKDLLGGTDRGGHMGAVKVARTGSQGAQAAVGASAIAWVDWDTRTGKVVLRPTKAFKELPLNVRQELTTPAAAGGGNPF